MTPSGQCKCACSALYKGPNCCCLKSSKKGECNTLPPTPAPTTVSCPKDDLDRVCGYCLLSCLDVCCQALLVA